MDARAERRVEPGKLRVDTIAQAVEQKRDASFGVVLAVVLATLLWVILIGLGVYLINR